MASTSVNIPDMLEAITSGVLPGSFNNDRSEFSLPTLSYVGSRGATHFWTVRVKLIDEASDDYMVLDDFMLSSPVDPLEGYKAEITVESQQKGGKIRDIVPTYVSAGKNLGKKNATNALTQALRNALGLYNKQKKRADVVVATETPDSPADANTDTGAATTGAAKFDERPPPMLVKKIGDSREATLTPATFENGVTVQRKLNGVHSVVYMGTDGQPVCYSRTGTLFPGHDTIRNELRGMFTAAPEVPEAGGPYFAGELYLHGRPLNWISGQARRGQGKDADDQLEYHIFDVFFPHAKAAGVDMASRDRQAYIDSFFAAAEGDDHPHIKRVENFPVASLAEANALAKQFLGEGYEGAIARKDGEGYRYSYSGYHSAALVKIKPVHDAEYPVVDFTQGTRGKDVGALIWVCEVPDPKVPTDARFNVVPKDMTYKDRYALFTCLSEIVEGPDGVEMTRFERDLKGLPLTVEYAELSADTGKPQQAKALAFRTYESGGVDPVRQLLKECLGD